MEYLNTMKGKFEDRQNRFVAHVRIEGKLETVHVKNTGRMRELLIPGADVVLEKSDNPNRKTKYDLISVYKEKLGWVNIDSQAANKVVAEWLEKQDYTYIKPEYKYGDSRLDFYLEKGDDRFLMEVKGCNLEIDGKGYFPDAPSTRAVKHLQELTKAISAGFHCIVAFVIPIEGVTEVLPNIGTHPEFGEALQYAKDHGVEIWNFSCNITENTIKICSLNK